MAISFGVDGAGVAYMTEAIWQVSDFVPVEICAEPGKSVLQFGGLGLMLLLSAVAVTDTNYFREENVSSALTIKADEQVVVPIEVEEKYKGTTAVEMDPSVSRQDDKNFLSEPIVLEA